MKKKVFLIVITIILLIISSDKIKANSVMYSKCNISEWSNSRWTDKLVYAEVTGEVTFIKLTDNKGTPYFTTLEEGISGFTTIPEIYWASDIEETTIFDVMSKFDEGICPREMVKGIYASSFFLISESQSEEILFLENPRYIIYSYEDSNDIKTIAEGYNAKGAYAYIGPDLVFPMYDEVTTHQFLLIDSDSITNYFKIDENFNKLLIAGNGIRGDFSVCQEKSKDSCSKENGFKIIAASSGEGRENIQTAVNGWLENNDGDLSGYNDIISLTKKEEFMNKCEKITENVENGTEYKLDDVNIDELITNLEEGLLALNEAYNVTFRDCATNKETSVTSAITSCVVYSDMLGIREFVEIAEENDSENMMNQGFIIDELYSDVAESLKTTLENNNYDINILDASSKLNEYTKSFYTAVSYLYSKAKRGESGLAEFEERLKTLSEGYLDLVERKSLGIYPVVDCETLIGAKLKAKIESYTNIIKIAIPIILIIFGIIDFTKAIFAGEDEMKSAQKKFIKRIAIAILVFLTPTIVNIILTIANKVWSIISPDSCGIF